jgi:choline-sulfatase
MTKLYAGCLLLLCLCISSFTVMAQRPNIITIVTDDQGKWAMGAYGNEDIYTPNMDRIAREGALLMNAFVVSPVCSPARATWLTGRYPTQLGITEWISPEESTDGLGLSAPTWAEVLQDGGYQTALFGKWHLGTRAAFHPTSKGFDVFMGFLVGGQKPVDPRLEVDGEERLLKGPLPDLLVDATMDWIEARNKDKPFSVSLHFRAPHLPYGPVPEEDTTHYGDIDPKIPSFPGIDRWKVKKSTLEYYASISSVDRNIGRVLGYLKRSGLEKNTIVLFTSDHGYNEGRHGVNTKGNGHWMAGGVWGPKRPNMWDTSIAIPMAIRWPGMITPGTQVEAMVSNLDMYRTILGMTGLVMPEESMVYGRDFTPALRGDEFPRDRVLFGQYDLHNNGLAYMRMIRTSTHKYVRFFHAHRLDELYDLGADPDEKNNLYRAIERQGDPDGVIAELKALLAENMKAIDDPLLRDRY